MGYLIDGFPQVALSPITHRFKSHSTEMQPIFRDSTFRRPTHFHLKRGLQAMSDEIEYPSGFGMKDIIAWGSTGLVLLDAASNTVIKSPLDREQSPFILREQEIYERFSDCGGHPRILSYHGIFESGIRLEYAPNYDLWSYLRKHKDRVGVAQKLLWATQILEALCIVHDAGVIHGDVTLQNIFLDENLNIKLADFAIDGSPLLIGVTASHHCPGDALFVKGDIFAFGSDLYEMVTGSVPYEGLESEVISDNYNKGLYPEIESLEDIGKVISNCWNGQYFDCRAVIKDLESQTRISPGDSQLLHSTLN